MSNVTQHPILGAPCHWGMCSASLPRSAPPSAGRCHEVFLPIAMASAAPPVRIENGPKKAFWVRVGWDSFQPAFPSPFPTPLPKSAGQRVGHGGSAFCQCRRQTGCSTARHLSPTPVCLPVTPRLSMQVKGVKQASKSLKLRWGFQLDKRSSLELGMVRQPLGASAACRRA